MPTPFETLARRQCLGECRSLHLCPNEATGTDELCDECRDELTDALRAADENARDYPHPDDYPGVNNRHEGEEPPMPEYDSETTTYTFTVTVTADARKGKHLTRRAVALMIDDCIEPLVMDRAIPIIKTHVSTADGTIALATDEPTRD